MGRRPPGIRAGGFSLLEVLIVTALAAGIIVLLGHLTHTVGSVRQMMKYQDEDWIMEQFLRQQLRQTPAWVKKEGYTQGDQQQFRFATMMSARHGINGPPATAWYWCDPHKSRLVYQEHTISPWWDKKRRGDPWRALLASPLIAAQEGQWWQETAIHAVSDCRFSYLTRSTLSLQWEESWRDPKTMPDLLRIEITHLGRKETMVFESKALFWSTFSGIPKSLEPVDDQRRE